MIDPHVHLRDWNQNHKETLKHGLYVAFKAGLDAVFEMPNTDPALTNKNKIIERIKLADKIIDQLGLKIFHGLYAGITVDPKQIEEIVEVYHKLFPRVVGLKMFAGHSTGNMGIVNEKDQKLIYKTLLDLGYRGVLAVHCEKESYIDQKLWNPVNPYSHTMTRPPKAEVESVKDQIRFADEFSYKGTLHILHISVPKALEEIERARNHVSYKISCGLTLHHALLNNEMMQGQNGYLLKMNPPLRSKDMQEYMFNSLLKGRIDWIETDHAPHTLKEKKEKYMSGIPALPYYPYFVRILRNNGASNDLIDKITHNNIIRTFGMQPDIIPNSRRADMQDKKVSFSLAKEYEFDAFRQIVYNNKENFLKSH